MKRGRGRHRPRRGMLLVVALVVLMLVALLAGAFASGLVGARRRALLVQREAQASLLADAGLARARLQLTRDPNFTGEDWTVPAGDLGGANAAKVAISVETIEAAPRVCRVRARAEFPSGTTSLARVSREVQIEVGQRPEGEKQP